MSNRDALLRELVTLTTALAEKRILEFKKVSGIFNLGTYETQISSAFFSWAISPIGVKLRITPISGGLILNAGGHTYEVPGSTRALRKAIRVNTQKTNKDRDELMETLRQENADKALQKAVEALRELAR